MPTLSSQQPTAVQADLASLVVALQLSIPSKTDDNLLIATWNIRAFASLTRKWTASGSDSPKRDLRGLLAISEILSRFDVIAVQELKGNLRALRDMLGYLGDHWSFLMTDVTAGDAGNDERLAFIFDTRRVKPSGLACELVVPPEWLEEVDEDALRRQFVRTPYAVSFRRNTATFILVTLHVNFGAKSSERIPELRGIARWMADWAKQVNRWDHNLLALGDFNIDRKDDPLWAAFTSTGLTVPDELNRAPRSVFADADKPTTDKFYDQIAWFTSGSKRQLNMVFRAGGHFDFLPHVYTDTDLSKQSISHRISDHFPLRVEFDL